MRKLTLALVLGLAACGTTREAADLRVSVAALWRLPSSLSGGPEMQMPEGPEGLRRALEADGQPAIRVTGSGIVLDMLMVPYFPAKGGGQVWAGQTYQTVTLRQGVLAESRGLGPDIMASVAPDAAQISRGSGQYRRVYEYLDGGDRARQMDFDCSLSEGGREDIVILARAHATRKVVETCKKGESQFQNLFWLDGSGKIRQSDQALVPNAAVLRIQHIID